jgi:hypothetical protein
MATDLVVWNFILTGVIGVMGFLFKGKMEELDRLGILLNKTREEIARDHVTRAEFNGMVDKLGDRFDKAFAKLEAKIEELRKE